VKRRGKSPPPVPRGAGQEKPHAEQDRTGSLGCRTRLVRVSARGSGFRVIVAPCREAGLESDRFAGVVSERNDRRIHRADGGTEFGLPQWIPGAFPKGDAPGLRSATTGFGVSRVEGMWCLLLGQNAWEGKKSFEEGSQRPWRCGGWEQVDRILRDARGSPLPEADECLATEVACIGLVDGDEPKTGNAGSWNRCPHSRASICGSIASY